MRVERQLLLDALRDLMMPRAALQFRWTYRLVLPLQLKNTHIFDPLRSS